MWTAVLIAVTLLLAVGLASAAHRFTWLAIPDPSRRVGCLDGLRGYLALFVFMHHCFLWVYILQGHVWTPPPGNLYANLGDASVALFFMITAVLFYPKAVRRLSLNEWITHFISRIFRLTPLLWAAVAAVVLIVLVQNEWHWNSRPSATLADIAQWLAFLGTPDLFGHVHTDRIIGRVTWSLFYEWIFYISLPVISLALSTIKSRVRPLYVVLALFLCVERLVYTHQGVSRFAVLFLAGMLAAEMIRLPKMAAWLRTPAAALIGLAALFSEVFFCPTAFAALPTALLLIFFAPVAAGNSYFGLLALPGSIVLGEISYGIYLLHGILLYTTLNLLVYRPGIYLMPMLTPVLVAITVLTHRLIEAPCIELGRRLARRIPQMRFDPKKPALASEQKPVRAANPS